MKIIQAKGNGQSQCRRCKDLGKWNVSWCCFMYEIEGYEGHYCKNCMEVIKNQNKESEYFLNEKAN